MCSSCFLVLSHETTTWRSLQLAFTEWPVSFAVLISSAQRESNTEVAAEQVAEQTGKQPAACGHPETPRFIVEEGTLRHFIISIRYSPQATSEVRSTPDCDFVKYAP